MPDESMSVQSALPLVREGTGSAGWWHNQISWAKDARDVKLSNWKQNIKAYLDSKDSGLELSPRPTERIRVNIEFEKTEQKRAQLFFQVPHVSLQPLLPGLDGAVKIFEAVVNQTIGAQGLNLKSVMREMIFDVLCPAGIAFCQVGYESYEEGTVKIQVGEEPDPDAMQQFGSVLGLGPTPMRPVFEDVPNVVAERYFVDRISPAKALVPPDFDGSDYDQAPWLGYRFYIDRTDALRRGWIREEEAEGACEQDKERLVEVEQKDRGHRGQIGGYRIWYYAARIDASIAHPDKVREIVFIDGKQEPVVHEDSRYQMFDDAGRFTQGIRGLPQKALTLRYVSDTPFPPSDCSATRRLVDELSEGRTQMVKQRRRAIPLRAVNKGAFNDSDDLEKIKRGDIGEIIAIDGNPQEAIYEVARAAYPRENFTFDEIIHADIDRMWALSANQSAVREKGGRTATELTLMQRATDTRLAAEQGLIIDFFLKVVESVAALIQMFADDTDYVEVVGENGAKELQAWDKTQIQGRYAFSAKADSAKRPDVVYERELAMTRYNLLANDPYTNREELVRQTYEAFDGDPNRLVRQPPPPSPEKPKISVSIKGDDLNPMMPQYQNVVNLLLQAGVPEDMMRRPEPGMEPTEKVGPVNVKAMEQARPDGKGDGRMGGLVQ